MAAIAGNRVYRKAGPSRTDFQNPVVWHDREFVANSVEFSMLCVLERVGRAQIVCARIRHRTIQEQSVKLIAKIVVVADVCTASAYAVRASPMHPRVAESSDRRKKRMRFV